MSHPQPTAERPSYVGAWIATLLLIVTFVFGLLVFPPYFEEVQGVGEVSSNVLFVGRFHPILVHLPVGILVFLIVMEMLCLRRSVEEKFGVVALLALWMGAAGAVFAVLAGIMLSREGGYSGGTFTLHQGLGIIGTAGILLGLVLRLIGMATENRGLVDGYRAVLFLSFGLMGVGAHFGANMVHGSKYMTQHAPPWIAEQITGMEKWMLSLVDTEKDRKPPDAVKMDPPIADPEPPTTVDAVVPDPVPVVPEPVPTPTPTAPAMAAGDEKLVFQHLILPILDQKCNNCHNEDKSKGDLRMDTYDMMMKGGETEGNVVPGQPDQSLTITRINLPIDDDEHMPPEGKDQISPEELALLRWWTQEGASNTMTVKDAQLPEDTKTLVEELLARPTAMITPPLQSLPARQAPQLTTGSWWSAALAAAAILTFAEVSAAEPSKGPSPAMAEAIKKVEAAGASLLPLAADSPSYRFTALNVAKEFSDAGLDTLLPVAQQIVSLDLARTQVTDAGLAKLAKMTQLKELRLDNTGISDAGLEHLKGLTSLEYLNVYGSKVTDAGIQKLAGLANLKSLYVWQTGVTKAGVAQLRGKLPKTHINNGWSAEDDAKPVPVVAAAPAKPAEAAKPGAAPAKPAEAAKPVAKAATIDPKVAASVVVYKDVVAPILDQKCVSCHGAEKSKGKLKMHTFADLLKGGSEGDVNIIPGKAADSLSMKRIALPLDDDEHMPPEDKEQLTKEETALLAWWINEGASETQTLDKAKRTPEIDGFLAVVLKDKLKPAVAAAPAAAPAKPAAAPAAKAPAAAATVSADAAAKAIVYSDVIVPILAEKCYSCHGEEKGKGKLRMHTFADLKRGGSEGEVNLVPGKAGESLMIKRVLLPTDDDEHMPPEDEPQITKEELALLKWWIDNGASETETVAAAKKTPEIEGFIAVALTKTPAKPVEMVKKVEKLKAKPLTDEQKKVVAEISAKMQAINATLMPLAQDTEQLRLSVINAADKFGDKELALLAPIAEQILWLDLARSQVTDAGLDTIAKMTYLERLHLENTKVTDAGVAKVSNLPALEYLNLYGTKVTDAGASNLAQAKELKKLFVWQTGVTKAGAKALEGKLPGLVVNVGLSEAEIAKLTAPPPEPPKVETPKPEPAKPAPAAKPDAKATPAPAAKPTAKPDVPPAAKPEAKPTPAPAAKPAAPTAAKSEAKPTPTATPPPAPAKPAAEPPAAKTEQKPAPKAD